ncbi:uncharacterized protein L201_004495 [Kwoniella dendrophila CBS 6074]|uniref:DNA topoisomerase (ATP-hydrolyzing) n=1 Tax=Kwoniella dendrophila CBS 6074 TaxID=1295534 RepID=A0AAX4JWC9_9TREE
MSLRRITDSFLLSQSSFTPSQFQSQIQSQYYVAPKKRRLDSSDEEELNPAQITSNSTVKKEGFSQCPVNVTEEVNTSPSDQDNLQGKTPVRRRNRGKRWLLTPSPSPPPSLSTLLPVIQPSHPMQNSQIDESPDFPTPHTVDQTSPVEHILNHDDNFEQYEEDELLIDDDEQDEEEDEEEDDDLLIIDEDTQFQDNILINDNPITSLTIQHSPHNSQPRVRRIPESDDAAEFERLMQRYEGKRRYEILADGGKNNNENQKQSQNQSQSLGTSQTSTVSSKSQREVEDMIDEDQQRREKTLTFLGSMATDVLYQLHVSQLILQARQQARASKRSSKKRKKKSPDADEEDEEASQELLIQEEDDSDGVYNEVSETQDLAQMHVGVKVELKNRKTGNDQVISFPDDPLSAMAGQTAVDALTCIIRIVAILYEAVLTQTVVTLRDIYYREKALFKTQAVVDKYVDDIVATAGLKRRDFCVCASAKGLVAATSMKIIRRSGEELVLSSTIATLIDPIERIGRLESQHPVNWILVVEKDAVFQTLCSAKLLEDDRIGSGVMITGKGFPDLATRQILHLLGNTFPNARVHALVDADPHGLSILSTYTFGSQNTKFSHEHAELPLGDRIEWLGLRATDFKKLGIGYDDLLPLEKVDIQLAMKMIKDPTLPIEWKRELSHMLHINRKAEIEIILDSNSEYDQHDLLDGLFDDDHHDGMYGSSIPMWSRGKERKSKLVEYIVERILA